jgi:hypothetical protein
MAQRFWPSVTTTAQIMRDWIEEREYSDPRKFARPVNQLFEAMGMLHAHFQILERSSSGVSSRPAI